MSNSLRYCSDIGMFAIDRPKDSCKWRTKFCNKNCYNSKLYKLYPSMNSCEDKLRSNWENFNKDVFSSELSRKKFKIKRIRFMTRGEAFACLSDVLKIKDILEENRHILFWIPTRAWRNDEMLAAIEQHIRPQANVRLLASFDPSNTVEEWYKMVKTYKWSTMFFGINNLSLSPMGDRYYKCPKTFNKKKAYCNACSNGCFNKNRVDVLLKKH